MSRRVRAHIRSNVYGILALFLVLTGGTAMATHPGGANTISSGDIINGQVLSSDIASLNVKHADLADNAVGSSNVFDGSIRSVDVRDDNLFEGGLTGADIHESTLSGVDADLLDGKESNEFLATDAVHTGLVKFDPAIGIEDEKIVFQKGPWTITGNCVQASATEHRLTIDADSGVAGGIVTTFSTAESGGGFGRAGSGSPARVAAVGPTSFAWSGGAPFSAASAAGSIDGVLSFGVGALGEDCVLSMLAG